jgi:hypothetical protein
MQISDIKSSLRKFFKNPYRIVVFNDSNLHIIKQLRFNARTLVLGLVSALFVVIIAVSVLIAFTPLREYIPGYPTGEMRQTLINSALTVDSLEQKIHTYDRYFQDFQAMLAGENLSGTNVKEDSIVRPDLSKLRQSNSDSIFKDELRQEKFQLSGSGQSGSQRQNAAEPACEGSNYRKIRCIDQTLWNRHCRQAKFQDFGSTRRNRCFRRMDHDHWLCCYGSARTKHYDMLQT